MSTSESQLDAEQAVVVDQQQQQVEAKHVQQVEEEQAQQQEEHAQQAEEQAQQAEEEQAQQQEEHVQQEEEDAEQQEEEHVQQQQQQHAEQEHDGHAAKEHAESEIEFKEQQEAVESEQIVQPVEATPVVDPNLGAALSEEENDDDTIITEKEKGPTVEVHEISSEEYLEEQSSAETVSSSEQRATTTKRIYISNVHYNTTEDEIAELFKNYDVVSIIIPHYTIRLFRYRQKPMGIAYADFQTHDQAAKALKEFHNHELNGRQLRIKFYYPYVPYSKRKPKRSSNYHYKKSQKLNSANSAISESSTNIESSNSDSNSASSSSSLKKKNRSKKKKSIKKEDSQSKNNSANSTRDSSVNKNVDEITKVEESDVKSEIEKPVETEEPQDSGKEQKEGEEENAIVTTENVPASVGVSNISIINDEEHLEYSKDTIYISKLQPKTTDIDLRKFFEEFEPSDIYIFKGKYYHRPFRFGQRHMCALITLTAENGQNRALEKLQSQKLNGKALKLYPAFNSKVEEIKKLVSEKHEELKEEKKHESLPIEPKSNMDSGSNNISSGQKDIGNQQDEEDDDEEDADESHIIITEAQSVAV